MNESGNLLSNEEIDALAKGIRSGSIPTDTG